MGYDGPLEEARKQIGSIVRAKIVSVSYESILETKHSRTPKLNGHKGKIHRTDEIRKQLEGL